MTTPHNVVVIVGSLRKESFTLKIANALAKLAPAALKLDVVTLHGISFFNQDLEATPPADGLAFREKIRGIWQRTSWSAYYTQMQHFALGLQALGFASGDRLAIASENTPEWMIPAHHTTNTWIPLGIPVLFEGLHIGVSFIQTYIFVLLACVYLREATGQEH